MEQIWIYVPDGAGDDGAGDDGAGDDDEEMNAWTGRIWSDGDQMTRWQFEVLRLAKDFAIYDQGVFQKALPVTALIDHQRPATLVRPVVLRVDPGKWGTKHPFLRTKLSGSFQALLTGRAIEDEQEPVFIGMGVESETFAAWYGGTSFKEETDENHRPTSIGLSQLDEASATIAGLGEIKAVRSPSVQRGTASSEVRTRTVLRITFDEPKSLNEALDLCLGVELLFGFLTGYRPKPPVFYLWWAEKEGQNGVTQDAELELGGVDFKTTPFPHASERLHMNGRDAARLGDVLQVFAQGQADLVTRISAVQEGRWFGATLNARFATVMPVLEKLLKARFRAGEERSYLNIEAAFFAHVDTAANPDVREFARKHLALKKSKAPSLATLIRRALIHLNDSGFAFDPDLAPRIAARRVAMFHSSPIKDEREMQPFYEETTATTAVLMLLTLEDLGVELGPLSRHPRVLAEFSVFAEQPRPPAAATNGP